MKKDNNELVHMIDRLKQDVSKLFDVVQQKYGDDLESLCGEWVSESSPKRTAKIYFEEKGYVFEMMFGNNINSRVKFFKYPINRDKDEIFLGNDDYAIGYNRDNDTMLMEIWGVFNRKKSENETK